MAVRTLACIGQFLTFTDGQVSIVCHRRLYSIFCFPGSGLQPLPSHSCTNSRRRTAKPAAYPAAYRFSSHTSPWQIFHQQMLWNPRLPAAELRQGASQHICSFPLQVKITSSLVCGLVYIFPGGFLRECCYMVRRFSIFSPRCSIVTCQWKHNMSL